MQGPAHLIFVSDDHPGFSRKRWGRGFMYFDERRLKISNPNVLRRIRSLVIPPVWNNVWICPRENGYLQSTGLDSKKRKQYLYHPDWTEFRQQTKFAKMHDFGKCLPNIRKAYNQDLKQKGWPKSKVTALVIYLLDNYYFRVGNMHYTRQNQSFGITTLRRKHLHEEAGTLRLSYQAKRGKLRNIKIDNRKIAKLIREISELPGYEIFRYMDDQQNLSRIDSSDINDYLKTTTGASYTAKDFRTWGASKLAIEFYAETIRAMDENPRLKFETTLTKKVAREMGNTVNVCRKYYIHPYVLKRLSAHSPKPFTKLPGYRTSNIDLLDEHENLLLSLLSKEGG